MSRTNACEHGFGYNGKYCNDCNPAPLDDNDRGFIARAKDGAKYPEVCATCGKRYLNPDCGVCRSLLNL